MDWIKVLNKHILAEYSDLKDSEFAAWIKIMALTAELEHEPTRAQILKHVHYKTLTSLQDKLNTHSIDLQYIVNKVLIDVQYTVNKKREWKENSQQYRERKRLENTTVIETSCADKIRLDKIRDIKKDIAIPEWIKPETWTAFLEVRKKLKAPDTEHALRTIITKLEKLKATGQNPNEILDESISNGWKGVFPLKNGGQDGKRARNSGGGSGIPHPKEWVGETPPVISEDERAANLLRIRGFIGEGSGSD
jgi:hypothetical protein